MPNPRYRLLSATPSPYARKVRIALIEKGIDFELATEVPWNATTETPKWNPLEKLPVLICEDGTSYYESRFILEYLELAHPEPRLVPAETKNLLAAKRLEVLCDGICDAFVLTFMERRRPVEHQSREWMARQQRKIDGGLAEIAQTIGTSQYAVDGRFSLGDIAAGTVVGYLSVRWPEYPWRDKHPTLAAYSDRMEQRPSFRATVPVPQNITDKVV